MDDNGNLTDQEKLDLVSEVEAEIAREDGQKTTGRRDMASDAQYYELGKGAENAGDGAGETADVGAMARCTAIGLRAMAMEGADPEVDPRMDMAMSDVFHQVADLAEMEAPSLGQVGQVAEEWVAANPEKAVAAAEIGGSLLSGTGQGEEGGNEMMDRQDMAVPGYGAIRGAFGRAQDLAGQGMGRAQSAGQAAYGNVRAHPGMYGAAGAGIGGAALGYGAHNLMDDGRTDMGPMDMARRFGQHIGQHPMAYGLGAAGAGMAGIGGAGYAAGHYSDDPDPSFWKQAGVYGLGGVPALGGYHLGRMGREFEDPRMDMMPMGRSDMADPRMNMADPRMNMADPRMNMADPRMNMMPMDRSDMGPMDFVRGMGQRARGAAGGVAGGARDAVGRAGEMAGSARDTIGAKGAIWKKIAQAAGIAGGGAAVGGGAGYLAGSAGGGDRADMAGGDKRSDMSALEDRDDVLQKAIQLDPSANFKGMDIRNILETLYRADDKTKQTPTERLRSRLDMESGKADNARDFVATGSSNEGMPQSLDASGGLAMALRRIGQSNGG